jgi:transcriptional regulator GlxA family with amidase domain
MMRHGMRFVGSAAIVLLYGCSAAPRAAAGADPSSIDTQPSSPVSMPGGTGAVATPAPAAAPTPAPTVDQALLPPPVPTASGPQAHTKNLAIVLFPGAELLDFSGPREVFGINSATFNTYTVAMTKTPIRSEGLLVQPDFDITNAPKPDIVMVPGGDVSALTVGTPLVRWIDAARKDAELTMSVCTGALVLARLGLLDGLHVTTHWVALDQLHTEAPKAIVDGDRRYIDAGRVVTTQGISAGIDGALHVVERYAGPQSARITARAMQYSWTRDDQANP